LRHIPEDAFTIDVTARMWAWEFNYPNGKKTDSLYIPVDTPIKLLMTSADVNHSLWIPAFRVKEDVIAGRHNYLSFTAEEVGHYDIACAEYCGLKHSMMYSAVIAMSQNDFDNWYNENEQNDSTLAIDTSNSTAKLEFSAHKLLQEKGCMTCHTLDGSEKLAPSFKNIVLGEKRIVLTEGTVKEVIVDDDYLRRSILFPNAEIVKGYAMGMMPSQKYNLSDEELANVIESIKSIN
jgi:cytochrome c oxidase subunit 2